MQHPPNHHPMLNETRLTSFMMLFDRSQDSIIRFVINKGTVSFRDMKDGLNKST